MISVYPEHSEGQPAKTLANSLNPKDVKNSIDFGYSLMVQLLCKKWLKETEDRLLRIAPRLKTYPDPASSADILSKNASANHLESHSYKNKGLKVPYFHARTKNIGGRGCLGVSLSDFILPTSYLRFSLTPLDSALTSKRVSKSFTSNTYEKHTN